MKLNNVDLNKIRVFCSIYKTLSIRVAAKDLLLTPAALSISLKSLESQLGVSLFMRIGHKLVPTSYADELARLTKPFLEEMGEIVQSWNANLGKMRGRLTLGIPGEFGSNVVIPVIAAFRREYPAVRFSVVVREPQALMPDVLSGKLNIIICDDGPYLERFSQISYVEVAREHLVLACSADFYSRHVKENHDFLHLKTLDHVAYVEIQEDLQKWYRHHFGKSPKVPVTVVADNARAVYAAVISGLGLGLLPIKMIQSDIKAKKIKLIETRKSHLLNKMVAIRLKERSNNAVEKAFLAALKERAALP